MDLRIIKGCSCNRRCVSQRRVAGAKIPASPGHPCERRIESKGYCGLAIEKAMRCLKTASEGRTRGYSYERDCFHIASGRRCDHHLSSHSASMIYQLYTTHTHTMTCVDMCDGVWGPMCACRMRFQKCTGPFCIVTRVTSSTSDEKGESA